MEENVAVGFEGFASVKDEDLAFAVIMARFGQQWIFCRHRERSTWEIPGGHRESGETALEAAKRELHEETGATEFTVTPVCVYFVEREGHRTYGALFFAEVRKLGPLPETEIQEIALESGMPKALTYPLIQLLMFAKVSDFLQGVTSLRS